MVRMLREVQTVKGGIMRVFRFLTFAGILIFACGTVRADDISVYFFSPGSSNQAVGSNFTVNVLANIPEDPGLVDFGFNLVWDQSMMQLTNVSGGTGPFDIWNWDPSGSIAGVLFPTDNSPASEYGSGILLAALDFKCLGEGTSMLSISDSGLFYGPDTDGNGGPLLGYTVTEGSVTQIPSPIPEPCTMILLLSGGLTGLAYLRKMART